MRVWELLSGAWLILLGVALMPISPRILKRVRRYYGHEPQGSNTVSQEKGVRALRASAIVIIDFGLFMILTQLGWLPSYVVVILVIALAISILYFGWFAAAVFISSAHKDRP